MAMTPFGVKEGRFEYLLDSHHLYFSSRKCRPVMFTNTSSNKNPGDGRPDDGDTVGWINRGLDWADVLDQADRYSITIRSDYTIWRIEPKVDRS